MLSFDSDPYEMRDALRRHSDLVAAVRSIDESEPEELDEDLPLPQAA